MPNRVKISPLEELYSLTGLSKVKASVQGIADQMVFAQMRREAGLSVTGFNLHFVFSGNPGTGKTTVARILGKILNKVGYLPTPNVLEVSAKDMIGEYVGQTSIITASWINKAMGGILFIDEAYSLLGQEGRDGGSFSSDCISTLLKMMEDHRGKFVVIAAGYPREMADFVNTNPGLKSRFSEFVEFENFSAEELEKIYLQMAEENHYSVSPIGARPALRQIMTDAPLLFEHNFSNARFVRNLFEASIRQLATRVTTRKTKHAHRDDQLNELVIITKADLLGAYEKAKSTLAAESKATDVSG